MTKREAKKWACGFAATLLRSDMDTCDCFHDDPDADKKQAAMEDLIMELYRRESASPGGPRSQE